MLRDDREDPVHAAVIDPPAGFSMAQLERAIVDLILRYLTGRAAHEVAA